ncbi:hypothetical protein [Oricola indica]|uniref:hypothetical protein n=1 Tax=Oricola indica TaxID=2872591 RepID=UPI003CCBEF62
MTEEARLDRLDAALATYGLIRRGGFAFTEADTAPPALGDMPARSVILVGHGGGSIWPHFRAWLAALDVPPDDPLDTWSRAVIEPVAARFGARAVFPFEKPWLPFQQWAIRAEGLKPSPLGILMHPEFGLWHAYRGALLFDVDIPAHPPVNPIHVCALCDGKPCMNACPAGAVTEAAFDVAACGGYLSSGGACRDAGCLARAACPVGRPYGAAQTAFHMTARLRGLDGQ